MIKYISKIIENFSIEERILKKKKVQSKKILNKINKIKLLQDEEIIQKYLNGSYNEKIASVAVASERVLGLKPYNVQIIGVLSLLEGHFIEMKTGEGKSLVAAIAACVQALETKTYIVTVNDYLAERDATEMKPLYDFFNIESGFIQNEMAVFEKKEIYDKKIIYGTNATFAFDYLKDNLTMNYHEVCQYNLDFAIVDEADSILIDEARTPLIISGSTEHDNDFFIKSFEVAKKLNKDDYEIDMENKNIIFNNNAFNNIEKILKIDNLYSEENYKYSHQILQSLKALHTFRKDVDYVVEDNKVKIIDEFNGRILQDTRFGQGLHQAIEVKENVEIKEENENLAQITYQSYFNMFNKLSGMSGTLKTEKKEFEEIYNSKIISVPTNKKIQRIDKDDKLFVGYKDKIEYLIKKVKEINKTGRPILIGTLHIQQSEEIANRLKKDGFNFNLLNAKNHGTEAETIKQAGKKNSITIATNMAGRGVDIKIEKEVLDIGGLYVFGFERYQNRRIDNQLIGRAGRQGNPGDSEFLLSLDDEILAFSKDNFLYTKLKKEISESDEGISLELLNSIVKKQQTKIENLHFDNRKDMYKYNLIISQQREKIYNMRKEILFINAEDFNILEDKIYLYAKEIFNTYSKEEIEKVLDDVNLSEEKVVETIKNKLDNTNMLKYDLKNIFLENIDKIWRKHLQEADNLKQGNHHKSMTQRDPLIEYQLELSKKFNKIVKKIKLKIVKNIYKYEEIEYDNDLNNNFNNNPILENIISEINISYNNFIELIENKDLDVTETINYFVEETRDMLNNFLYSENGTDIDIVKEINNIFSLNIDLSTISPEQIKYKENEMFKYIINKIQTNISKYEIDIQRKILKDISMHFAMNNIDKMNEKINILLNKDIISEQDYQELEYTFVIDSLYLKINIINNLLFLDENVKEIEQ